MRKLNPELIDDDNPEWSEADFVRARPAKEILPELFGKTQAASMLKPKRGRPASTVTKEQVAIRFDPNVLAAFRASGPGWQTRMNAILADWLKSHSLKELPS